MGLSLMAMLALQHVAPSPKMVTKNDWWVWPYYNVLANSANLTAIAHARAGGAHASREGGPTSNELD